MVKLLAPKRSGYFWAKLFVWLPGRSYMAWVFLAEFGYNFSSLLLEIKSNAVSICFGQTQLPVNNFKVWDIQYWSLLKPSVCNPCTQVWGSRRFGRLSAAARAGQVVAPADMRYLKKGLPTKGDDGAESSRGRVVTFLRQVYESVAETLPDVRDETYDGPTAGDFTVNLPEAEQDPYVRAMSGTMDQERLKLKRNSRGVRTQRMGLSINTERRPENGLEKRWLPPGFMKDYYEQFLATEKMLNIDSHRQVAFSTFWRVWYQDFGEILQFRPTSSHAICATCVRHKLIIKSMSSHLRARQAQVELFAAHLRSQYSDRITYWDLRAQSRLRNHTDVLVILDGMDQAKFQYPRSDLWKSKDLQGLQRPKAHVTGAIIHGRGIVFAISPADMRKDANSSIELLAFCLQLLSKELDLSKVTFHIQSDNTSREVKNNIVLRWLGAMVCHGTLVQLCMFWLTCPGSGSFMLKSFVFRDLKKPRKSCDLFECLIVSLLLQASLGVPGCETFAPGTPMRMWTNFLDA